MVTKKDIETISHQDPDYIERQANAIINEMRKEHIDLVYILEKSSKYFDIHKGCEYGRDYILSSNG